MDRLVCVPRPNCPLLCTVGAALRQSTRLSTEPGRPAMTSHHRWWLDGASSTWALLSLPMPASSALLCGAERAKCTRPEDRRASRASRISHALSRSYHSFIGRSAALVPQSARDAAASTCRLFLCLFVVLSCPQKSVCRPAPLTRRIVRFPVEAIFHTPFVRCLSLKSCSRGVVHCCRAAGRRVSLPSPVSAPTASARRRQLIVLRVIRSGGARSPRAPPPRPLLCLSPPFSCMSLPPLNC